MLIVLGGLAEFERSPIMTRTQAGIQRARERGVAFGRPTKLNAKQRRMNAERYAAGERAALAREFEVGEATVWRPLKWLPGLKGGVDAVFPSRIYLHRAAARA